ncbi:Protein shifted [Orchesella cincta]|uniref:Protein shifted n=1 Tax=Orchesella cincta TaxID=48709 RepID=A0A1D2N4B7_ORCCI|nr:Protein shifted [Orchesella cincta]
MNLLSFQSSLVQVLLLNLVTITLVASLSEGTALSRGRNRNGTAVEPRGGGGRRGGRGRGNNGNKSSGDERNGERPRRHRHSDLSMWIDEKQVKMFSGYPMLIHIITDGYVLPYLLDPDFEKHLPVIPAEVGFVNFTWRAGDKKYFYNFDRLQSFNEEVLLPPIVSVDTRGRIPRRPKVFSVFLPCSGKSSGIASFTVGLLIETRKGKPLAGTPMRLRLRKECSVRGPDPECDKKCANGGYCNKDRVCRCADGYMGNNCQTALCYPQCMNGGVCTAPGVCSCPPGYIGLHCEGGKFR